MGVSDVFGDGAQNYRIMYSADLSECGYFWSRCRAHNNFAVFETCATEPSFLALLYIRNRERAVKRNV